MHFLVERSLMNGKEKERRKTRGGFSRVITGQVSGEARRYLEIREPSVSQGKDGCRELSLSLLPFPIERIRAFRASRSGLLSTILAVEFQIYFIKKKTARRENTETFRPFPVFRECKIPRSAVKY